MLISILILGIITEGQHPDIQQISYNYRSSHAAVILKPYMSIRFLICLPLIIITSYYVCHWVLTNRKYFKKCFLTLTTEYNHLKSTVFSFPEKTVTLDMQGFLNDFWTAQKIHVKSCSFQSILAKTIALTSSSNSFNPVLLGI